MQRDGGWGWTGVAGWGRGARREVLRGEGLGRGELARLGEDVPARLWQEKQALVEELAATHAQLERTLVRVAGKIVRKYTLSRYPFNFTKLQGKIALFSTESSFQTAR